MDILKELLSNPETAQATVNALFVQYKPLVYGVFKELFKCFNDLLSNDDYFDASAAYFEKMVNALTDHGFSRNEAMSIILSEKQDIKESSKRVSTSVSK